jgi:putative hydrolase of the HAD superfamily
LGLLIWDFDGTLAVRPGGWRGALAQVLHRHLPGFPSGADEIRPFLQAGFPWDAPECAHPGLSADEWWEDLHPLFARAYRSIGVKPEQAAQMAREVRSTYLDLNAWACYPDTTSSLQVLSDTGWKHVILSNHVPELNQVIEHLGLAGYFLAVFNSATTGWEKPNRQAFKTVQAWAQSNLKDYDETSLWMIGDNPAADIRGAEEAGIRAVLVRKQVDGLYCFPTLDCLPKFFTSTEVNTTRQG